MIIPRTKPRPLWKLPNGEILQELERIEIDGEIWAHFKVCGGSPHDLRSLSFTLLIEQGAQEWKWAA